MSPKFRGDTEDWLDDQDDQSDKGGQKPSSRKRGSKRAGLIAPERTNATVAEVFPKQCAVVLDEDGRELACAYRRAAVFRVSPDTEVRERTPVAVGDRVLVEPLAGEPGAALMLGVAGRRNALERPAPGRSAGRPVTMKHVIAANVDLLVVVASVREPDFPAGLVDRYLIAAQKSGIDPLICITKVDLLGSAQEKPWCLYSELGFQVREVSAKTETGLVELRAELMQKRAVFVGHSGVGKTSLLSKLFGHGIGRTEEVNPTTGKGRHTTTGAVLLRGPSGTAGWPGWPGWIDTPGVREFGLLGVASHELPAYFGEFSVLACTANGCLHRDEARCNARSLPRYASYRRILESLLAGTY